jgi:hypothetical protein
MVQSAPRISPVNQLHNHFVANSWSKPKTYMQNDSLTDTNQAIQVAEPFMFHKFPCAHGWLWRMDVGGTCVTVAQDCVAWTCGKKRADAYRHPPNVIERPPKSPRYALKPHLYNPPLLGGGDGQGMMGLGF